MRRKRQYGHGSCIWQSRSRGSGVEGPFLPGLPLDVLLLDRRRNATDDTHENMCSGDQKTVAPLASTGKHKKKRRRKTQGGPKEPTERVQVSHPVVACPERRVKGYKRLGKSRLNDQRGSVIVPMPIDARGHDVKKGSKYGDVQGLLDAFDEKVAFCL